MTKQSYIIDTGSSITSSPCKPYCKKCGRHINSYYHLTNKDNVIKANDTFCSLISQNSDFDSDNCEFNVYYSEGSSISGFFYKEKVRFGNDYKNQKDNIAILGCTIEENNLFYTQKADGVMGLLNSDKNFVSILKKLNSIKKNVFTICLSNNGGYFSLGEIETLFHKTPVYYVKLLEKRSFYDVLVDGILINDEILNEFQKDKFSFFIDSGTTLTYFPKIIFEEAIQKILVLCENLKSIYLKNVCGKYQLSSELGPCFEFDNYIELNDAIQSFWPNITFLFNEYEYIWSPKNYIFNNSNIYKNRIIGCLGFALGNKNRFTLGSTWMVGHDIIFDKENNKIGFAESECDRNINNSNKESINLKYISSNLFYDYSFIILIFFIIIFLTLCLLIIYLCIGIMKLRKGKDFCFLKITKASYDEEFYEKTHKIDIIDSFYKYPRNDNI